MVRIPKFLIILFYLVLSISNKSTKWGKKVKLEKYLIFNLYFILTIKYATIIVTLSLVKRTHIKVHISY